MTARIKTRPSLEMVFEAALGEIGSTLDTINAMLAAQNVPESERDDLNIVLTEILTNSVRHGYCSRGGWIACAVTICDTYIACRVTDGAQPFDPSFHAAIAPDPSALAEGGYGWPLILALAKSMEYHREGEKNLLSFKIPLSSRTSKVA